MPVTVMATVTMDMADAAITDTVITGMVITDTATIITDTPIGIGTIITTDMAAGGAVTGMGMGSVPVGNGPHTVTGGSATNGGSQGVGFGRRALKYGRLSQ